MLINLKVFSKNKNSLILFFKIVKKICEKNKLKWNFSIKNLQKIEAKNLYCILKSPHVNKIAQEQFQYCLSSKKIRIYTFQFLKLILILRQLKSELFPDIQIKTQFLIENSNLEKLKTQIFNSKLYKLKIVQSQARSFTKIRSKILLYFKLFDSCKMFG